MRITRSSAKRFAAALLMLLLSAAILLAGCGMTNPNGGTKAPDAEPANTTAKQPVKFRFVALGDTRANSSKDNSGLNETVLRDLLKKIKELPVQPAFILFTGDQVVGGADVEAQLTAWKKVVEEYYPMTAIYPSLGNHENDENIFSKVFSHLPDNQLQGYQRTAYYFDYGNARFITLNSNRKSSSVSGKRAINAEQREWLKGILDNNGKTHNFVQFHHPAYPIGAHMGDSLDGDPMQRDALWDILQKNNVTTVFVGHEHNYNRREIDSAFNKNNFTFANPVTQLTVGGGGAPLSNKASDTKKVVVGPLNAYHFTIVDVEDGKAQFKTVDVSGKELDSYTVTRPVK